MVGIMMKLADHRWSVEPANLHEDTIQAIDSLDAVIAFTMVSEITATLFRQISPYQTEIVIQPRGIKIPIVNTLEDVFYLATTKRLDGSACLVRRQRVVLVWSNMVESILPHGAEVEKLLLEAVSPGLNLERVEIDYSRCGVKRPTSLRRKRILEITLVFSYHQA
jgi:hypothetical protein